MVTTNERENTIFVATVLSLVSQVVQAGSLLLQSRTRLPTVLRLLLDVAPAYPQVGLALFCTATPVAPLPNQAWKSYKAVFSITSSQGSSFILLSKKLE